MYVEREGEIIIIKKNNYQIFIIFILFYFLSRANEVLAAETQMFERFLKRVEPLKDLAGPPHQVSTSSVSFQQEVRGSRRRSKSRSSTMDRLLKLTAEQKCDIAQREIEELRDEIDRLNEESEKVLDTYKVSGTYSWHTRSS